MASARSAPASLRSRASAAAASSRPPLLCQAGELDQPHFEIGSDGLGRVDQGLGDGLEVGALAQASGPGPRGGCGRPGQRQRAGRGAGAICGRRKTRSVARRGGAPVRSRRQAPPQAGPRRSPSSQIGDQARRPARWSASVEQLAPRPPRSSALVVLAGEPVAARPRRTRSRPGHRPRRADRRPRRLGPEIERSRRPNEPPPATMGQV